MTTLESVRAKVVETVYGTKNTAVTRVLTLADILRAIEKAGKFYAVDEGGYFMEMLNSDLNENIYGRVSKKAHWNPAVNLDDQTPEFLEFLDKILTN